VARWSRFSANSGSLYAQSSCRLNFFALAMNCAPLVLLVFEHRLPRESRPSRGIDFLGIP
jgi:hypothetical protein